MYSGLFLGAEGGHKIAVLRLVRDGRAGLIVLAADGGRLLKDPVFQGILPLEGETEKEYDISYTVTNNRITTLPQTGSSGLLLPVTIGTALLGLAGCTGFFVARSKKAKSGKEN